MTAYEVQKMIGVKDYDIVAHGYTMSRNTVNIWFENGKLVLEIDCLDKPLKESLKTSFSEHFDQNFFFEGIKRWYIEDFNPKLRELFETFCNTSLPFTKH